MPLDLDGLLAEAVRSGASDLHLKVPSPPRVRIDGILHELPGHGPVTTEDTEAVKARLLNPIKREEYERRGAADLSYVCGSSRFRVAAFNQRGCASFVFRSVLTPPTPAALGLPDVVTGWTDEARGLIAVTGPTGTGKSSTTAALLRLINETRECHIITIEDPVEFLHEDAKALVSQREIGIDAPDHHEALRAALRQDPDVIVIGEVRDEETAVAALRAAETGHLVLCTMHTLDASETIQRFIDLFSSTRADFARRMLASTLVGIVSQRLVPGATGGRKLNAEVLVASSRVRDLIDEGAVHGSLRQAIFEGDYYGMRTFDQDLLEHVKAGRVSQSDAIALASNPHDFKLMLTGGTVLTAGVPGAR